MVGWFGLDLIGGLCSLLFGLVWFVGLVLLCRLLVCLLTRLLAVACFGFIGRMFGWHVSWLFGLVGWFVLIGLDFFGWLVGCLFLVVCVVGWLFV